MHDQVLLPLLPFVVWLACAVAVSCLLVFLLKLRPRQKKLSLTRNLLRSPGESVRQRLAVVDGKLDFYVLLLVFLPPLLAILLVAWQKVCAAPISPLPGSLIILFLLAVALLVSLLVLVLRELATRRKHSLAFDCKLAVGQELNLLMRQGCGVFHDFPGDGCSIDHVLVGPSGVYAVVTKGRAKPEKRRRDIEDRVFYDGRVLSFPGWSETGPVGLAQRHAAWLADWLGRVVGEQVPVKGVVFLPGWIVETGGRHDVSVINEKSAPFLGRPRGKNVLSEASVQRIAYQVEQRCRNMAGGDTV